MNHYYQLSYQDPFRHGSLLTDHSQLQLTRYKSRTKVHKRLSLDKGFGNPLTRLGLFLLPHHIRKELRDFFSGRNVPETVQENGVALIESIDDNPDADELDADLATEEQLGTLSVRTRFSYIASAVAQCKCVLPGIGEETASNRLVAHRWLNSYFEQRNMRPTHIRAMLPLAVEAIFIKSNYEIEALQMRQTHAVQDRVDLANTEFKSHHPRWFLNWFGAERRRKPVERA